MTLSRVPVDWLFTPARYVQLSRARQSNGIGARMVAVVRAQGTLFGPVSAVTQAVGINVALGQTGKALTLIKSIQDVSPLPGAAQHRYAMDKAMAQADAKQWDESLDTLEDTLRAAPDWARHQALPRVIADEVGAASTAKLRRVAKLISPRGGRRSGLESRPVGRKPDAQFGEVPSPFETG